MEIRIDNRAPDVDVKISKTDDGAYEILLTEKGKKPLGDFPCGSTIRIGSRDYIVLDHKFKDNVNGTAVIAKECVEKIPFGSDCYSYSDVRRWCNSEFLEELQESVGGINILTHCVDLVADDGTGDGNNCVDHVSILSANLYRRYRKYLPVNGERWWLATRASVLPKFHGCMCYVGRDGTVLWDNQKIIGGVRPFCVLKSSIFVSGND